MHQKNNLIITYDMNIFFIKPKHIFLFCGLAMIYCASISMSGDNSLRDYAQKNTDQMKRIRANQEISITVFVKKRDGTVVVLNQLKNNQSVHQQNDNEKK